jgi:integrase
MARRRLSELMIGRIAPPKSGRLELADAALPGLSLRITPDGTRSFALRYRIDGKQQRMTLGRYDPQYFNLAAARAKARTALDQLDAGKDPAKVRREVGPERGTVAEVVDDFTERHLRRNTKRAHDHEQMLRRDVVRCWADRSVASITRRDVLDLIDEVVDRGSPVTANRLLSWVKTLFSWAVERGVVDANPAAGIKPPHREKPRAKTLTEPEQRAVWGAFEAMGYPFGSVGKLLLLTAQRRGEVAAMRWDQIDLDTAVWRLPSESTKAGREHVVPLAPQAVEILRQVPRFERSPLVFPASRLSSDRPVSGFSKALKRAIDLSGVGGWHWHDLRRSAATGMAKLAVPPHICERVLNHSAGRTMSAVARVYNVHSYGDEVRRALEMWSAEVERIVTMQPAKVVPLREVG